MNPDPAWVTTRPVGLRRPDLVEPSSPLERLPEEWEETLASWREPRYRALQVFRWIHQRGIFDPTQMTDLPRTLRARLAEEGLAPPMEIVRTLASEDTTRKLLVRMRDGKEVETVLIPQHVPPPGDLFGADAASDADEGPTEEARSLITQCISTQVGCAMGCVFCASGIAGLKRHMTAGEIVSQVLVGRGVAEGNERIRNVVLMGMGEPLHNYDAVARALVLLTHPDGIGLSTRRVTLSTSGLVPQIDRLGADFGGQVQLAISLHAVDDARRSAIMPINRKHPLAELVACLRRYPMPPRRRITIEYTLISGKNDDPKDADALAELLRGIPIKVNLIPLNEVEGVPLARPGDQGIDAFQARLLSHNLPTFVRKRKGGDIAAACGQLVLLGAKRKIRVDVTAGG